MPRFEHISEYVPQVQDRLAAVMLKQLIGDVRSLEQQLKQQRERADRLHSSMRSYSDQVARMAAPSNYHPEQPSV
ncbi:MAG TPA: hypothetical protein PLN25_00510 [Deltaproteobacteria bacterium]|nr:hypothetical protein [Deltaproteobacteria bacterium]HQB38277.1 hypothetical protein [Deltaproteobacteria bacterium]